MSHLQVQLKSFSSTPHGVKCRFVFESRTHTVSGRDEHDVLWKVFRRIHGRSRLRVPFKCFSLLPFEVQPQNGHGSHQPHSSSENTYRCQATVVVEHTYRGREISHEVTEEIIASRIIDGMFQAISCAYETICKEIEKDRSNGSSDTIIIDKEEWIVVPSGIVTLEECHRVIPGARKSSSYKEPVRITVV